MQSNKHILKIIGLFSGVQGLNLLLNLVRTKLAALLLGPSGIGLNSIYNEMRELIHTTTNVGMDVSGIRQVSQAYESDDKEAVERSVALTRSWVLLLALVGTFICLVLAEPLSWITFSDFEHTWDFVLLSPSIAFSTLACGEMAILKGTRRIKILASVSVLNVLAGIITTIPIYYIWGMAGVVPAIVLLTMAMYIIVAAFSYGMQPLRLSFGKDNLKTGLPMLVLGMSFVLTGMVSHGTELAVRTYLNNVGSLHIVGLYSAGFTIVMTYGGVVFASLESDYFPRLSGVFTDSEKRVETMVAQTEMLLLLITPLAAIMMVVLPWIVPLLFSDEFMDIVPMAQMATIGLVYRAVYLPAAYMPLSAGDYKSYFCLETLSYVVILCGVILGYNTYGLEGTGIALTISNLFDMIVTLLFVRWRYNVTVSRRIIILLIAATLFLPVILRL